MSTERIQSLDMSIQDVIMKLSQESDMNGYNPGALRVLMQLYTKTEEVDPDNVLGGLGSLLALDTHRVYGSHIWIVYKDICGESTDRMIGLLRAIQLGLYYQHDLQNAIKQREAGYSQEPILDQAKVDELIVQVRARLPNFKG